MARPKGTKAAPKAKLPEPKLANDANSAQHTALELAEKGYTWPQIAGELGVTTIQAAKLACQEVLDRVNATKMGIEIFGKEAINYEKAKLNGYLDRIMRCAADGIERGHSNSMAVGLKAAELKAKLNDLFPSERHEHTLNDGDPEKAKQLWKELFGGAPADTAPAEPKPN